MVHTINVSNKIIWRLWDC